MYRRLLLLLLSAIGATKGGDYVAYLKRWIYQTTASTYANDVTRPTSPYMKDVKIHHLTSNNFKAVLSQGKAVETTPAIEWMVLATDARRSSNAAIDAWNEAIPYLSASLTPPNLALLDCEIESLLCRTWPTRPPQIIHILIPKLPCSSLGPIPEVRFFEIGREPIPAAEIAVMHLQKRYRAQAMYNGTWNPLDEPLASSHVKLGFARVSFILDTLRRAYSHWLGVTGL